MTKRSVHPTPNAFDVRPEPAGEGYVYNVNKFMTVREVRGGEVVLLTRRGKLRIIEAHDPALRPAGWWERLAYGDRFPGGDSAGIGNPSSA